MVGSVSWVKVRTLYQCCVLLEIHVQGGLLEREHEKGCQ